MTEAHIWTMISVFAFAVGAIFGAWVYAKGREKSSPIPQFLQKQQKPDNAMAITPTAADARFEAEHRKKPPVKA